MSGRLLILGASGHGKVVGDCARAVGSWSELLFFDDRWPELSMCGRWPVVERGEDLAASMLPGDQVFVAIGNSATRLEWLDRLQGAGMDVAIVVHPSAIISQDVSIGAGSLVVAGAVVNVGCMIGKGCIVNTGSTVDHDCILGDGVHICPGVNLAGDVQVGNGSWIGIGSSVIQGVRIGASVMVGAGAAVVDHVADGLTVVGVPARPVDRNC